MKKLILLSLLFAPAAGATDFAGYDLLLPVAGRTPGAHGSAWKTDLYITNADRRSAAVAEQVTIIAGDQIRQAHIPPRATIVVRDLTHSSGVGSVRIGSSNPNAKLTARARIFNVGSAQGEYGQTVQALPVTKLSRETYLPGLSGVHGNRTNVGIANPASTRTDVFLTLYDADGEFRGGFSVSVEPRGLRLFNDLFSHFQTGPLDNAMLQVTSTAGVYAYASVVRSDSGDADFITGTGLQIDDRDAIVQPACESPAPLHVTPFPSDGWIVTFHPGTPATVTTRMLEEKYGFTANHIFEDALQAFSANVSHAVIAALRCEVLVQAIDQNAYVPVN